MDNIFVTILGLLGGLAIFIFGMNMMSENLQKIAGEKMKNILALLTKNPVLGVIAGALTTAVLQSSSATTVMAIGFVSARLMGLPQAISIILGANIGTTITAQIIAFKITDYILLFVFVGFVIMFLGKTDRTKSIGRAILGFGLLFLGIETMGDSMKPLASSPVFVDMISQVTDIPILGVLVGTLMTVIVQSSSATIAVLQNLASQPGPDGVSSAIGLQGAIPILLGDNIGTTITALLASIGQSRDAKRVAVSHSIFNISGAFIFVWLIGPFAAFITMISPTGPEVEVISRQIANAHTSFNVIMTCIWLPLIWLMVKIVMRIIPDKKEPAEDSKPRSVPLYLEPRTISQPTLALQMVAQEILRGGNFIRESMQDMSKAMENNDTKALAQISEDVNEVRDLSRKTTDYLAEIFAAGVLNEQQATRASDLMGALNDVERIATLTHDVTNSCMKCHYSAAAMKDLAEAMSAVEGVYAEALHAMASGKHDGVQKVLDWNASFYSTDRRIRKGHMARVASGECSQAMTAPFNRVLYDIGRIGNGCVNIVELVTTRVDLEYFYAMDTDETTNEIINDDYVGQEA